jgi:hypothetical protein
MPGTNGTTCTMVLTSTSVYSNGTRYTWYATWYPCTNWYHFVHCTNGTRVVCPGTQRYVDQGSQTIPGRAAEAYAVVKAAKYADQPNFVPFIVEAGGYINRLAHLFLDTLRGSQGSRPADSRTQGTVTPRRHAQGADAGSGSDPSLHARRHCSDSRGRPRR